MSELQNNFANWRKIFIKINLAIATLITLVEIIMSITLYFQNLILTETLFDYISEYFIVPNTIIWGFMLLTFIVFKVVNRYEDKLRGINSKYLESGSLYDGI